MLDLRKVVNLKPSGRAGIVDRDVTTALCGALAGDFKSAAVALGPMLPGADGGEIVSTVYSASDILADAVGWG